MLVGLCGVIAVCTWTSPGRSEGENHGRATDDMMLRISHLWDKDPRQ